MIILLFSFYVWGNAEPIDIKSSLKSTGNLVALQKSNIEIKNEKLKITINDVTANIEVNYKYFNNGEEDTVFLAFPVDFLMDMFDARENPQKQDLNGFDIKKNGKRILYDHIIEKEYCCDDGSCNHSKPKLSLNSQNCDGSLTRKWYVTKVVFPKKKETNVTIRYRIRAFGDPNVYSGNPIPRMDTRKIFYDFSPAQYFGMGKAEKMEIELDFRKMKSVGGKIEKITPSFFKQKSKGIYTYSGKDFDFKKNPNLRIVYDVKEFEMFNYFKENRRTNDYMIIPIWKVSSSIDEKKYGARNLFDGKQDTAWCFKGGKEQFVEVELFPPLGANYVSVMNGYLKNKETYDNNGKVLDFEVVTDCPDKKYCIYDDCSPFKFKKNYKPDVPKWNDVFLNNPFSTNRPIWKIEQSAYLLRKPCKVKILIKKTKKGKKYNDICISEIFIQ